MQFDEEINNAEWPEPFMTEELGLQYSDDNDGRARACMDGLIAWSKVMAGCDFPECFGRVMANIAIFLHIDGKPDSFMAESVKYV